jgi:adenosylhomocysteine nucleosidase
MTTGVQVAVIAALPREVAGLVGRAKPDAALKREGVFLYRTEQAVVVAAGMGASRVALAFEAAMAAGALAEVVSTGLAGSCSAGVAAGDVVEAGVVVDARTGERLRTSATQESAVLVTADAIASVREKARLRASYGAAMVDMEAATVGRLAQAHGLRFRAIKGISDAHDFELASLSRFADARGQFRTAAFALHTALRPGTWTRAMTLGRESGRALEALHTRLRSVIAEARQNPFASKRG